MIDWNNISRFETMKERINSFSTEYILDNFKLVTPYSKILKLDISVNDFNNLKTIHKTNYNTLVEICRTKGWV